MIHNRVFLLIIAFATSQYLYAQFNPISFKNYSPKWIHYFQDSTAIEYYENHPFGMSHLSYPPKTINENDSVFYFIYNILVNSLSSDGAYIEKIDIKNKKLIWSNYFDSRNNDRFESPSDFFISKNGDLKIVGYRKVDNGFFTKKSKFFSRTYNADSGTLISHFYANENDTLAPFLYAGSGWSRSQIFKYADNYLHNSSFALDKPPELYFNRVFYELNSVGHKLNESIFVNQKYYKYNLTGPQIIKTNDIEFVNTFYSFNSINSYVDSFNYNLFLQYFDTTLNLNREFDITNSIELKNGGEFSIKYVDDQYIIIMLYEQYEPQYWKSVFFIFNHKGDLLDSFPFVTQDGEIINYMLIGRLSADEFLLGGCSQWHVKGVKNKIHFYSKKMNDELKYLNSFEIEQANHFLKAEKLIILDNRDVLYVGLHGFSEFQGNNYLNDLGGGWKSIIHFDAHDVGLVTNNKVSYVSDSKSILVFPNPASKIINVKFSIPVKGRLVITNMLGVEIFSTKISADNISIKIDHLISGYYSIALLNENNIVLDNAFFLKFN